MTVQERRAFSVSTFARHQGRVLLIRHRRLGAWLPVGGEIHPGETPLEAARRELREETGLEGRFERLHGVDGTPPGLLGYEEHLAGSKGRHLNFAFVAEVDTDEVRPNDEFEEWRWVEGTEGLECPRNVAELARLALAPPEPSTLGLGRAWLAAFNAREPEALVALYAEGGAHASPELRALDPHGELRGPEALLGYWRALLGRSEGMRLVEKRATLEAGRLVFECERVSPEHPTLPVALVLVFEDGRVRSSRLFLG